MTDLDERRFAAATERNREPILAVLERVLPEHGVVLELASGSGQHATFFASRLPQLDWQPSDVDPEALRSIAAWRHAEASPNLREPVCVDVTAPVWPVTDVAAILCCNLIHIAPWSVCKAMLRGAAALLPAGGVLVLYGPYKVGGAHTAPSNDAFDLSLRGRNPAWGVRDLEAVVDAAAASGLALEERVAMPANNFTLLFRREGLNGLEAAARPGDPRQTAARGST